MVIVQRLVLALRRRPAFIGIAVLAMAAIALAALALLPGAFPAAGARSADVLRAVVGVQAVSQLESASNGMRDQLNQYRFGHGSTLPQISWSASAPTSAGDGGPVPATAPHASKPRSPAPSANVVTALPQIGWQPFGLGASDGTPTMARAMLLVDPHRPYAAIAVVRMDLTRLSLHVMPGTIEPVHSPALDQLIPSLGMVPPMDQGRLAAAFNGGFKAIHGHYGMMDNGLTLLKPVNGIATVAIYKDGSVRMGTWNQDLFPSPDMIAFRQNCPPLVDAGQVNPALDVDTARAWGFSHNTDITWRTGLGLTQDGRTLIYAVGNGTNAKFLARALQEAGAYWAMQLDINEYYAQFDSYTHDNGQLASQRLLDQMINSPGAYLTPNQRDFFYVTLR